MTRQLTRTLLAAGIVLAACAASSAPAAAVPTGSETFHGINVKGGAGTILSSTLAAEGVFDGVGRIVETANLPGDPDTVNRDDLVFAGGSMHLVSTILAAPFSLDPHSRT